MIVTLGKIIHFEFITVFTSTAVKINIYELIFVLLLTKICVIHRQMQDLTFVKTMSNKKNFDQTLITGFSPHLVCFQAETTVLLLLLGINTGLNINVSKWCA